MDIKDPQSAETPVTLLTLTRKNVGLERQVQKQAEKIKELTEQCRQLLTENEELKAKLNKQDGSSENYNTGWHWYRKITWTLKTANKPLLSQELIVKLQQLDENFNHNTNPVGFLSAYLTNAVKRKLLSRHKQQGTRGYYYCLPHWMERDALQLEYLKMLY
jgi:nucleotidyltransferase/DNA polymerase involved in DNA repair